MSFVTGCSAAGGVDFGLVVVERRHREDEMCEVEVITSRNLPKFVSLIYTWRLNTLGGWGNITSMHW